MSEKDIDRGLKAVARVRSAREKAARQKLQIVNAELRRRQDYLDHLNGQLADAPVAINGTVDDLHAAHAHIDFIRTGIGYAAGEVQLGRELVEIARTEWEGHNQELSAVEHLLAKRAERRRKERDRRDARDLDDIASQRWLRSTSAELVAIEGGAL